MGIWAGPYVAAAALLVVSGILKVRRPTPTARALTSAGVPVLAPLARVFGVAEVVVGAGALALDSRAFPALVAASYLAFAGFVALTLVRAEQVADCGCFGAAESPPTVVHLVLNLFAAGISAAVALGSGGSLVRAVDDQPLLGLPFLVLAGLCAGLTYAAMTLLPRTLGLAAGTESDSR